MSVSVSTFPEWRNAGEYYRYEGHNIFFVDTAETTKPVLLLLHGFPTSSWDWHEVWPELCKHFRVIAFDFLGFGLSDKPLLDRYSILMQADIAEALLHSRGVVSFHLMAHDYGDTVAQELLARDKETDHGLIQSCVLLNGGVFPEVHKPLLMQRLLLSPIGTWLAKLASFKKFKKSFDTICAVKMTSTELEVHWKLMTREHGRKIMPKLVRYMDERVRYRDRWVSALRTTSVPLLFVVGEADPISGRHMLQRFEALVPHAGAIGLPAIGHYPQNEDSRGVLQAALPFWFDQLGLGSEKIA